MQRVQRDGLFKQILSTRQITLLLQGNSLVQQATDFIQRFSTTQALVSFFTGWIQGCGQGELFAGSA